MRATRCHKCIDALSIQSLRNSPETTKLAFGHATLRHAMCHWVTAAKFFGRLAELGWDMLIKMLINGVEISWCWDIMVLFYGEWLNDHAETRDGAIREEILRQLPSGTTSSTELHLLNFRTWEHLQAHVSAIISYRSMECFYLLCLLTWCSSWTNVLSRLPSFKRAEPPRLLSLSCKNAMVRDGQGTA